MGVAGQQSRQTNDDTDDDDPDDDQDIDVHRRDQKLDLLAGEAAAGDRDATERLLAAIRIPVTRYCRARMGESIGLLTPDDVTQDVLLAVFKALPRYRPGETAAMAFVYGIARNKVVDAFRAAGRDRSDPSDSLPDTMSDLPGPEAAAVLGTEVGELRRLLDQLSEPHREVLVLRIALQLSAEETARIVGSTPGAVRVTQHRAMTKLRALLDAESLEGR